MTPTETQRALEPPTKDGSIFDNITIAQTVEIFHALSNATDKARRVMRQYQDAEIDPSLAADRLNDIIATLRNSLPAEREPAPPVPESLVKELLEALINLVRDDDECEAAMVAIGVPSTPDHPTIIAARAAISKATEKINHE